MWSILSLELEGKMQNNEKILIMQSVKVYVHLAVIRRN